MDEIEMGTEVYLEPEGEKIKNAKLIANPGCHASGFMALIKPLIYAEVLNKDAALSRFSLTGYL